MEDSSLPRWNRDDWKIFFGNRGPTIRQIIECLGLSCNTDGGVIKFSEPELQKLSDAVQEVSQSLPRDLDELLKSASSLNTINKELDQLLTTHGPAIWGENANRKRLLLAAGNLKKTYPKDLFYEVSVDKQMLKIHLHRWIYMTAHKVQPRKMTRHSAGGDLDPHVEPSVSSIETSGAQTIAVCNTNTPIRSSSRKRKANSRNSIPYTDGDSTTRAGPAKKRPHQNATLATREFPQEPLPASRQSTENIASTSIPNDTYLSPYSIRSVHGASSFTGRDGPLPEASVPPMAPEASCSRGQSRPSPTTAEHEGGRGDTMSTPMSHIQTQPAPQTMMTYPTDNFTPGAVPITTVGLQNRSSEPATDVRGNISGSNVTRARPLSPADVSNPHDTIDRTVVHQRSSERDAMPGPREVTILQCELLQLLLGYLFPRDERKVEEADLLRNLEDVWAIHEQEFKLASNHLFAYHREALFAWISGRRNTSQLRLMVECQPSTQTPEMVELVLAMNDLRILRLKWKTINAQDGNQVLSPEDLLCRAFAMMTKTEGIEQLFKEGLGKLEETALSGVRSEDLTISM